MRQLQETTTALTAALQSEQQAKTEALHRIGTLTQVQTGSVFESAQCTNWLGLQTSSVQILCARASEHVLRIALSCCC
jgi:hypothetical protein